MTLGSLFGGRKVRKQQKSGRFERKFDRYWYTTQDWKGAENAHSTSIVTAKIEKMTIDKITIFPRFWTHQQPVRTGLQIVWKYGKGAKEVVFLADFFLPCLLRR